MTDSGGAHPRQNRLFLLSYAPPGKPSLPIGILLPDARTQTLHWRLPEQWDFVSDEFDRAYLSDLSADIAAKVDEMGGTALLSYLEDTLSNVLLLSELPTLSSDDADSEEATNIAYQAYVLDSMRQSNHRVAESLTGTVRS
jgi:hypothetical protein